MKRKTETYKAFTKRKNAEFQKKNAIKIKDIGRKGQLIFIREAWTFMPQSNLEDKVFVLERLRKKTVEGKAAYPRSWKNGDVEYRIGYFIVGKVGRASGRWVWGQYCPFIPKEDFGKLIKKAKREKTIL